MRGSSRIVAASNKKIVEVQKYFLQCLLLLTMMKTFFHHETWHTSCSCPNEQEAPSMFWKKSIFQKHANFMIHPLTLEPAVTQ